MGSFPRWNLNGDEFDSRFVFADLGYDIELNENWHITAHAGFSNNEFDFVGDRRRSSDVLGELTLFGTLSEKAKLVTG